MISFYKFFFYRTYVQQTKLLGEGVPRLTATLVVSLLVYINLLTIVAWFQIISGQRFKIDVIYFVAGSILSLVVNSLVLTLNGRDKVIFAEFQHLTEAELNAKNRWCWFYEFGTFIAFFVSIWILSPYKG